MRFATVQLSSVSIKWLPRPQRLLCLWPRQHLVRTMVPVALRREQFVFQSAVESYTARAYDQNDRVAECAQEVELDSRRVFGAGFTVLRAAFNIVLALLFELLSLLLHVLRKVCTPALTSGPGSV